MIGFNPISFDIIIISCSKQVFCEVAYKASSRQDLLDGMDEVLATKQILSLIGFYSISFNKIMNAFSNQVFCEVA